MIVIEICNSFLFILTIFKLIACYTLACFLIQNMGDFFMPYDELSLMIDLIHTRDKICVIVIL